MGHLDINTVNFSLPDGRPLLSDVSLRVGEGAKVALIGPNGTGKTTLGRIIAGDLVAHEGAVTRSGGLGVMRQFVGQVRDESTVRDLLLSVAPEPLRRSAAEIDRTELLMMERDSEADQMAYAHALVTWGDVGGYDYETLWDVCTVAALGMPFDKAQWRKVTTLSGGEQKRVVLEALLRGPEEVLLLDEPDNYLDVPAKRWLEDRLAASGKVVLLVSHDRELLARAATRIVTIEPGVAGGVCWVHGGSLATYHAARDDRNSRLEELRRRWDEERAKLKALVLMYKTKAAYNDGLASRYQAAQTRLAK
ncbi:MAG: ATP-binding cassette domain-containing protein, partial [Pedococcus sp.]